MNIALLVDFDNVILGVEDPGFDIELVVDALYARGVVVMGRAYGDWYRHNRHRRKLMEHGIELVETPVFGPLIKNSADIRIVLDAFEIAMTQNHIDAFCLVSGDSDFLPLIKKLQSLGKHVIVIAGNKFTSDLVRRNCNEFVSYEYLYAEATGIEDPTTLEGAFALLERALQTFAERGTEARSSAVKQMMVQLNGAFSERNFGYAQFRGFLDRAARAGVIRLGGREGSSSGEQLVFLADDPAANTNGSSNGVATVVATFSATPTAEATEPTTEDAATNVRRRRRRRRANGVIENVGDEANEDASEDTTSLETPAEDIAAEASERRDNVADDALDAESALETSSTSRYETMNGTGQNLLKGRNVRRGKLRFTGRSGKAEVVNTASAETPPTEVASDEITGEGDPLEAGVETGDNVMSEIALSEPTQEALDALTLTTEVTPSSQEAESAAAGETATSETAVPATETSVPEVITAEATPTDEAAVDANETTPDAAPKRRRRPTRRKTTAVAERSLPETAPADEAEAARNEADADSMGITFPGATFQIIESDATAPEGSETPSAQAAPIPEVTVGVTQPAELVTDSEPDAGQVQRVDTTDNPPLADAVAPDVVAAGEAIVAAEGGEDDAARKPRRGRRGGGTRRRTTKAAAGNEAGEGTGGDQSAAGEGESASTGDDAASSTTGN